MNAPHRAELTRRIEHAEDAAEECAALARHAIDADRREEAGRYRDFWLDRIATWREKLRVTNQEQQ